MYKYYFIVLICILFTTHVNAQKITLKNRCDELESLLSRGLPKSALEKVNEFYEAAKLEQNNVYIIKAILLRNRISFSYQEGYLLKQIDDLDKEIKQAQTPVKEVLFSFQASLVWSYTQRNRWTLKDRHEVIGVKSDNIQTWDLKSLTNKTIQTYLVSLQHKEQLQKIDLSEYDLIIDKHLQTRELRPTLYDLLAHRAIDFFMNCESSLTEPVYAFVLDNPNLFSSAKEFSQLPISTKDSSSFKFYALTIFKNILSFHLNDTNPSALIDADIKRLQFIKENCAINEKDSLYENALQQLYVKFNKLPAAASVLYELAVFYKERALLYTKENPSTNKYRNDLNIALNYCLQVINNYPQTFFNNNCDVIINEIKTKSIHHTTELINPSQQALRALIDYKNINKIYCRIVKSNSDDFLNNSLDRDEFINKYIKIKPLLAWEQQLPEFIDKRTHAVELTIPPLSNGEYIFITSISPSFTYHNTNKTDSIFNKISYSRIYISNIAHMMSATKDGGYDLYVTDRTTGNTVEKCKVNILCYKYVNVNYNYKYVLSETQNFVTSKNGFLHIPRFNNNDRYYKQLQLIYNNDTLVSDFSLYNPWIWQNNEEKLIEHTYLFTDRSIYRPGQTIYFKGLVNESKNNEVKIKSNVSIDVEFRNVNYELVSKQTLTTNEYGSVQGTFTIPMQGLTGTMQIRTTTGAVFFKVEEYKRPKFEVKFDKQTTNYKLNDSIKLIGKAQAYAGNMLTDAKVVYRVVRTIRYPYFYYWCYYSYPAEMELTHGTTTTNDKGIFTINFKALPDLTIDKKTNPVFDYTIYTDVTDINGETHHAETSLSVGYISLLLSSNIPSILNSDSNTIFTINTTNLSGEFTAAKGTIMIYKLKEIERLIRQRLCSEPDTAVMAKEEYVKLFPNDVYDKSDLTENQPIDKQVFSVDFDTKIAKQISISDLINFEQGHYVVIIKSADNTGTPVELKQNIVIYSTQKTEMPVQQYAWFVPITTIVEPGSQASFMIGTSAKKVSIFYEVERDGNIVTSTWLTLSNEQKLLTIPIVEAYRGNICVHIWYILNNRLYSQKQIIQVPYSNKELKISFESFRDKLQPGQQEEWRIKILGPKADKVAAEMMATLYDASLDAFTPHAWNFNLFKTYNSQADWTSASDFNIVGAIDFVEVSQYLNYRNPPNYERLLGIGYNYYRVTRKGECIDENEEFYKETIKSYSIMGSEDISRAPMSKNAGVVPEAQPAMLRNAVAVSPVPKQKETLPPPITPRTNFNETAFFYPQLQTNENGEIIIKFTIPESLTRWKMLGLAHTKELEYGLISNTLVTQKDLMVTPNAPRFLREGDTLELCAKISNITDKSLNGTSTLLLSDALTNKPLSLLLASSTSEKVFKTEATGNTMLKWTFVVPQNVSAITYRITATAGNTSDGEENVLPVLSNRMLVTETLPLPIKGKQTKTYTLNKLVQSVSSSTLKNYNLTLEYTSNPAWYAVQALPYLMEYPYECSEQLFNRFYANAIASFVANSNPRIKQVFESWKNLKPEALLSNLEKNQELKNILIEETPWVRQAKDESERKKRIALLFDLNKMSQDMSSTINKLAERQMPSGAFPWFNGMYEDRYITQYILTGIGHLKHLGIEFKVPIISSDAENKINSMLTKAINFLDNAMNNEYLKFKQNKGINLTDNHVSAMEIQYIYMRSFFLKEEIKPKYKEAFDYYFNQIKTYWLSQSIYLQGMSALALNRFGEKQVPLDILKSIKEKSLSSEEMGVWWRDLAAGYYWYQAPIESQALLIEAFDEITNDKLMVDDMKVWLIKQKQTQDWKTTRATAEACYALLLRGTDLLADTTLVQIKVGDIDVNTKVKQEAIQQGKNTVTEPGTGYIKTSWQANDIKSSMGNITLTKTTEGPAWGAMYWQYIEQLDKITPHDTPLKIVKKLTVERASATGPVLQVVSDTSILHVGEKVWVRIEISVDRAMEYVHLKDMRASGFEPVNVISRYQYKNGLGYYESTRDAATNFFISYLPKGNYVFEYPLTVSNAGNFSNGIATMQCMYAPEFSAHSKGVRVIIK